MARSRKEKRRESGEGKKSNVCSILEDESPCSSVGCEQRIDSLLVSSSVIIYLIYRPPKEGNSLIGSPYGALVA